MKRKRRREFQKEEAVRLAESGKQSEKSIEAGNWPGERLRYLWLAGIVLIAIGTAIIYGQTVRVPTIDYEDPFYLVYSPYVHVSSAFSRMDAVWTEPYFANFHPVTTTTWLVIARLPIRRRVSTRYRSASPICFMPFSAPRC
ncbi:MAG: hypothetical protein ABSH49_11695 [Bryobacteraceae bacterium]|jgi:hypothetical protein